MLWIKPDQDAKRENLWGSDEKEEEDVVIDEETDMPKPTDPQRKFLN